MQIESPLDDLAFPRFLAFFYEKISFVFSNAFENEIRATKKHNNTKTHSIFFKKVGCPINCSRKFLG
jgi:hypothetical protein